jgi:PAS domain S-box-containing protein
MSSTSDKLQGQQPAAEGSRKAAGAVPGIAEQDSPLREFVDTIQVPLQWLARDGTVLWANNAALRHLGYPAEEYIGHSITEFLADSEAARDVLERLQRDEELHDYETQLRRKDGTVDLAAITSTVHHRQRDVAQVWCVVQDVRQRHRAFELQERLAAIVESSDDAIVSKDLNGIIQSWNRGAEQMFGYRSDEVVGRHISMLAPPDRLQDFAHILGRIGRGEKVEHFETQRRTKDGRILTVSLSVSPVRDHSGRIVGASKIARNITDQKRLSEAQARLAAIVESADDAIISKDLDGFILSWNSGAQRIFGYTAEEVIGQHISMLAAPDCLDEIPAILARLRRGERVDHYQTRRRTKDGRILTVSLTISPIRDVSGKIIGISKIARDVSEQVLNQEALRAANEALARSNADLEQFAYCASHDLQEPLRAISGFTAMLKRKFGGQLGPEADDYIRFTIQGVKRMHQLLNDLLEFTRVSMVAEDIESESEASEVLTTALENLQTAIADTGAVITHSDLPKVRMHQAHLQQVFQNLIGNAIRYRGPEPPRIHVAAEKRDGEWIFSVRDNGIGIDSKYKDQIFGIFKRLHSTAEYPGTGMGLAICERLVQRNHGRIWVESELGKGSTFFFTIPAGDRSSART